MKKSQINIIKKTQLALCLFLVINLLIAIPLKAQEQIRIDSLTKLIAISKNDTNKVNTLYKLTIELLYYDETKATEYANQTLELSKKLKYNKGIALAYSNIGHLGNIYGHYDKAVEYYLKAIKIFEQLNDKKSLGKIHGYLGDVYGFIGGVEFNPESNRELCLSNLLKSVEYLSEYNDTLELAKAYSSLGNAYVISKKYQSALESYQKALDLSINNSDIHVHNAVNAGIAGVYFSLKEYQKAITKYLYILNSTPNTREYSLDIANIFHDIAKSYLEIGNYQKAIDALDSSLAISRKENYARGIRMAYSGLDNVYYAMGNYKKAYEAYNEWVALEQDLLNENTQKQINELQKKYESEKKEQQIFILNFENEKLASEILTRNIVTGFSIGIFILILLLILLFIKQQRTKELKNRAELEQKALRAQMNPHFIFNSLNSIQRMFMEGDYDLANDYMGDFGQLLRIILENSGKSAISINDEINTLKLYLDIEKMRTDGMIEYKINVDPNIDLLNNFMPPLIIQPFVENAIWHGILPNEKKGDIYINIERKDKKTIVCTITDNGIGIEQSKKLKKSKEHLSKGMKLTTERLNHSNAVKAEELESGGTKITILIPLTQ